MEFTFTCSVFLHFLIGIPLPSSSSTEEFDFVIVGGGSAGCVLAARLSEVPGWTVLLIESGGRPNIVQEVPLFSAVAVDSSDDWSYRTEKSNSACLDMDEGRCHWPRGKVLGGSSILNYMVHSRGHRQDYDNWENLGNRGWSYKDILPYFIKYENMSIPELANDTKYHSTKGEMIVSHPPYHTPLATAFIEAGTENGFKIIDYNAEKRIGFSYLQATIKNGSRWSAYHAFLQPVVTRKNLHIIKRAVVIKILIHPENRTAYGVKYILPMSNSSLKEVHAKKEVIISAGAINSPQLLMLSGIGPREHLQNVGIPVLQDSKVGHNLQDHPTLGNLFFIVNDSVGIYTGKEMNDLQNILQELDAPKGKFTIPGGIEALSLLDLEGSEDGYPDLELLFAGITTASVIYFWKSWGAQMDVLNSTYDSLRRMNAFMIFPISLKTKSRGRVMLRNEDPLSKPLLFHNYFTEPEDIKVTVKGIKQILKLIKTKAFQKYDAQLYPITLPSCLNFESWSDEYWECCIRHMTFTMFHQCCTNKMGPDSDPETVVDPTLRVRGIGRLRVVDSSVMPVITTGHPNAAVYMIAEKGAGMIKDYWTKHDC